MLHRMHRESLALTKYRLLRTFNCTAAMKPQLFEDTLSGAKMCLYHCCCAIKACLFESAKMFSISMNLHLYKQVTFDVGPFYLTFELQKGLFSKGISYNMNIFLVQSVLVD